MGRRGDIGGIFGRTTYSLFVPFVEAGLVVERTVPEFFKGFLALDPEG